MHMQAEKDGAHDPCTKEGDYPGQCVELAPGWRDRAQAHGSYHVHVLAGMGECVSVSVFPCSGNTEQGARQGGHHSEPCVTLDPGATCQDSMQLHVAMQLQKCEGGGTEYMMDGTKYIQGHSTKCVW